MLLPRGSVGLREALMFRPGSWQGFTIRPKSGGALAATLAAGLTSNANNIEEMIHSMKANREEPITTLCMFCGISHY